MDLDVNGFQGIDQGIGVRYSQNGSYEVNLRYGTGIYDTPQVKLWKKNNNNYILLTDTHSFPLINNKWYHVKIEALNENIKVWIDNTLIFDFTDTGTNVKKGVVDLEYSTGEVGVAYMRFDNVKVTALAPPPSLKTPLILIPGIGGSELKVLDDTFWNAPDGHGGTFNHAYSQDEKVWVNEGEAAQPGNDDYFDVLRMKTDGVTSEANMGLTNNLVSRAYEEAINFFTSSGYALGTDFYVFPYDWRKDLSGSAGLLDQKIQSIKSQTGSQKVDIVAHSMGGLVARNYIADPAHAQNVRKLFTLGTPHLGSVDAIKKLRYGDCLTPLPVSLGPICLG
ncbi:alpha/beta hydrolase, partial [Candidatus Daviesbacteria bacterium]|nr:alpha/beta hydrolase [Candidatus Daviesbacteria bacterium]